MIYVSSPPRGNVIPYVLAILVAMLLAGQYVYNAYKVSNESTRIQNTSDAAAYSVATVYAQNSNFVAVSNRALVANQISMAQTVTMVSWVRMVDTLAQTINSIGQYIPYVGNVTSMIESIMSQVSELADMIVPKMTQGIQLYTQSVSLQQKEGVVLVTMIADDILKEVVEKNDADVNYSFARVLVANDTRVHLSQFYGQNDCKKQANKLKNNPNSKANEETLTHCRQFRNVTVESRDGFTANRTYRFAFPGMPDTIFLPGVGAVDVGDIVLSSKLSIERAGGTTMGADNQDLKNISPFTTWSAIDSMSIHASTKYIDIKWSGWKKEETKHEEMVKLGVSHAYVGDEESRFHHNTHKGSSYWRKNPKGSSCTDPDYENGYGFGYRSWNDGAFKLMDVISLNCGELSETYGETIDDGKYIGLTDFYNLKAEGYVEESDHLMIYLRKNLNDVESVSDTVGNMSDAYRLDRYQGAGKDALHGAAGAGVYFRRGNDRWMLNTAKRSDNKIEFGNVYTPFWEPRLSKITNAERILLLELKGN